MTSPKIEKGEKFSGINLELNYAPSIQIIYATCLSKITLRIFFSSLGIASQRNYKLHCKNIARSTMAPRYNIPMRKRPV